MPNSRMSPKKRSASQHKGTVVLEEPRQTVNNWIKGSNISNDGICKIIEADDYDALAFLLGTEPYVSNAKATRDPDTVLMHNEGVSSLPKCF